MTGLFVSIFIGDEVIISGLRREKKVFDKTETEIKEEGNLLIDIKLEINKLSREMSEIKNRLGGKEDYEKNKDINPQ